MMNTITRSLMDILNKIKRCKIFNFYSKCPSSFKMSKMSIQNVHHIFIKNVLQASGYLTGLSFPFSLGKKDISA